MRVQPVVIENVHLVPCYNHNVLVRIPRPMQQPAKHRVDESDRFPDPRVAANDKAFVVFELLEFCPQRIDHLYTLIQKPTFLYEPAKRIVDFHNPNSSGTRCFARALYGSAERRRCAEPRIDPLLSIAEAMFSTIDLLLSIAEALLSIAEAQFSAIEVLL